MARAAWRVRTTLAALGAAAWLVAGCFPVAIDVDRSGRALIPRQEGVFAVDLKSPTGAADLVSKPIQGAPAWARWSPDGQKVLVTELLMESHKVALHVVTLADKTSKPLGELAPGGCALWSPKGDMVSVVEEGSRGCVLSVINVASGEKKKLLENVLPSHDWLPDGQVVAFQAKSEARDGEGFRQGYSGDIVTVDAAGGQAPRSIASAVCPSRTILDADAEGKRLLIVQAGEKGTPKLSCVTIPDGEKKTVALGGVIAGLWSPDGQRIAVLLWSPGEGGEARIESGGPMGPGMLTTVRYPGYRGNTAQVAVCDGEGRNLKVVADNVAATGEYSSMPLLPSWADAFTVLYFQDIKVYGDAGMALHLMSVKYTGLGREDLQPLVERKVAEAVK